jgi:FkbM family methyltransferase
LRKVFIDCGAYDGASVRKFKSETPDFEEWEVYSFEADKTCWPEWPCEGVEVIKKAVWIEDGTIEFNVPGVKTASSSIVRWNGQVKPDVVECIDLSKWIMEEFDEDDHIFLKLDVEGAEYEILRKMINDGSMDYIDRLNGEFHNKKCGVSKDVDAYFTQVLSHRYGLEWLDWAAEPFYKSRMV